MSPLLRMGTAAEAHANAGGAYEQVNQPSTDDGILRYRCQRRDAGRDRNRAGSTAYARRKAVVEPSSESSNNNVEYANFAPVV